MKRSLIGCCLAVVLTFSCGQAADLPSVWARSDAPYSVLTASGSIAALDRKWRRVFLASSKPFWAPGPSASARITLWPTQVLLSVSVSIGTAITLDGKKARFEQLAPDQSAVIQYMFSVNYNVSSSVKCFARRIDARTKSHVANPGR